MAEPLSAAEEALKKISAQLECSICHDTCTDAKLLPCFHSFCKECLERLVVQDRNGHILTCPICRTTTLLPPAGVSGLQTDFHMQHLFEIRDTLHKIKEPQNILCEKCKRFKAVGFCRDCNKFVCEKCTEMHETWEELATHQIVSITTIETEAANLVPPTKKAMYCSNHSENVLKIYCKTCGEVICNDCTIRVHQGHNYDLVTDVFQQYKEEIVSSLQPVKQQLATVNKAVQALDTRTKEIEDQRTTIEAEIHSQIDHLVQALQQRRGELVSQLDQLTQQRFKGQAAQRAQCELVQTQLSSCLDYMEASLKTGSEGEILALRTHVLKEIQRITAEFNLAPEQETEIQFITDTAHNLHQACQEFGVITLPVCPQECYTTGDGLTTATVGEEATVTFHARVTDGSDYSQPIHNLTAELVCSKDGTTTECQVKAGDRSKCIIRYTPTNRGKHQLHIKIKEQSTKGSPFTVAVGPQGQSIMVIANTRGPWGLATNSNGHIVVAENILSRVSVVTPDGKKIQSFGSKGSAKGHFNNPTGVAVDTSDNIYIADNGNHRIQKFTSAGRFIAAVGTQGSNLLQFFYPVGIGFNKTNGKLYVCDQSNHRIQVLDTNLVYHSSFGSNGTNNGQFQNPLDAAFDSSGNVYIADYGNHCIQVFTPEGWFLRKFGSYGSCPSPYGVALDSSDSVYMVDHGSHSVWVFSSKGQFLRSFVGEGGAQGQFKQPRMVHVDENDFILVSDFVTQQIHLF